MARRGRKSAAALAVVTPVAFPAARRPGAPSYLSDAAQAVWCDVVGARKPDFFDRASLPLLETYCVASAEYRRALVALEAVDPAVDPVGYARLARAVDMHAARIGAAGTKLRLTQQSRTDSRGAGRAAGDHRSSRERILANYGGGQ